jgi:hypothetical protein
MKKLVLALVCLVVSVTSQANPDCYTKLLKGGTDSVVHQMNNSNTSEGSLQGMTYKGLTTLLRNCGCDATIKKIQCGEAVRGNNLTEVCYVESNWGYFLVNKDYLDNLNVIFNRWD